MLSNTISEIGKLTVAEFLDFAHRTEMAKRPTVDKNGVAVLLGKSVKTVNIMLEIKEFPDWTIVDGYAGRGKKKKVMFYTDEILKWLKKR